VFSLLVIDLIMYLKKDKLVSRTTTAIHMIFNCVRIVGIRIWR